MQTFGLIAAMSKDEASVLADDVRGWLEARGCTVIPEEQLIPAVLKEIDAIIVLGGDGLMMRSANAYPDVPLLGINFGKVGFLAMVERADWEQALTSLLEGDFSIEDDRCLGVLGFASALAFCRWLQAVLGIVASLPARYISQLQNFTPIFNKTLCEVLRCRSLERFVFGAQTQEWLRI